jgi:hypothetical protein
MLMINSQHAVSPPLQAHSALETRSVSRLILRYTRLATVLSWSEAGKTRIRSIAQADRARMRGLTENYRRLRQARANLVKLHQQVLDAIDRLAQVLRLPPPSPSQRNSGI